MYWTDAVQTLTFLNFSLWLCIISEETLYALDTFHTFHFMHNIFFYFTLIFGEQRG